jgi:ribosomal protein L40E
MMAELQLKEKHEETCEKAVEGIMICIECGSPNTTVLTKAIYCRDCRGFKLFRKRKPHETLSQDEELGVFKVK